MDRAPGFLLPINAPAHARATLETLPHPDARGSMILLAETRYLKEVPVAANDALAGGWAGRCLESLGSLARLARALGELLHASGVPLSRNEVNLSLMARCLLGRLKREDRHRAVLAVVHPGLVARGDSRLLGIVLRHLLGNAWKFTSPRSLARIEVGCCRRHGAAAYFVSDNGVGFEPGHAGRLFRAFGRLHPPGDFAGHGLGLAVARRIVRRHGGRCWAESAPGRGATFYFTLGKETEGAE